MKPKEWDNIMAATAKVRAMRNPELAEHLRRFVLCSDDLEDDSIEEILVREAVDRLEKP